MPATRTLLRVESAAATPKDQASGGKDSVVGAENGGAQPSGAVCKVRFGVSHFI